MPLQVQTPAQYVSSLQNGVSAFTNKVKNFSPGSVAGAFVNTVAAQLTFIQQQAQYLVGVSRAATSVGPDLTSFVADYYLVPTRIAAVAAQGPALFSRAQPAPAQVIIPVGTVIQTKALPPTLPVQYQVIADTTNPNYSASLSGYTIALGASSVSATVQSLTLGVAGNALSGTLSVIVSAGVGADTVANLADITNGIDQESDAALRVRFQLYVSSLAKASKNAIASAVLATQAGLTYTVNDQLDQNGTAKSSYFTVVADDGSGAIPSTVLASVKSAVDAVRAAGISFTVISPLNQTITVNVTGTSIQPSFAAATVRTAIQAAIIAYINGNGVGGANVANAFVPSGKVSYVGIANVVAGFIGINAGQGLSSYSSIVVNGASVDVPFPPAVNTSVALAIATGAQTVTPLSMSNITVGQSLYIEGIGSGQEVVTVTSITATTFTATFAKAHSVTNGPVLVSATGPNYWLARATSGTVTVT